MGFDKDDNYYSDELHYQGFTRSEIERMSTEERNFHTNAAKGGFSKRDSEVRWINERGD